MTANPQHGPVHRIGAGYCPLLTDGHLSLPDCVDHVEAGWRAMTAQGNPFGREVTHRSLHLSRAPACESPAIQDAYIDDLVRRLPSHASSVGLHLCGPYRSGMGWLGVGPAYLSSDANDDRARRFFAQARERVRRPIFIENANFYDTDLRAIRRTWSLTNELCGSDRIGMVLDLAHLWIHARNADIEIRTMLGLVDLDAVQVVHLSGVKQDSRGVWHDAHSESLAPELLEVLGDVLRLLDHPITIVVEHTDPIWGQKPAQYHADFQRVEALAASTKMRAPAVVDEERVAIGLLANVVFARRLPELRELLGPPTFRALVGEWAETFIATSKADPRTIATFAEQVLAEAGAAVIDPLENFQGYVHARAQSILDARGHG